MSDNVKNGGELPESPGSIGPATVVVGGGGVVVISVVPSMISTNTQTTQSDIMA